MDTDLVMQIKDGVKQLVTRNAELQARVDELTEQLESAHAKNRSLKAHIAKMQEGRHGWHVKYPELERKNAELQARVDELTAERDELRAEVDKLRAKIAFMENIGEYLINGMTLRLTREGGDEIAIRRTDVSYSWEEGCAVVDMNGEVIS